MRQETAPLIACPECDLLQRAPRLAPHGCADCVRCGAELFRDKPHGIEHTLAYLLAAAIVFVVANAFPLMELDANGLRRASTLLGTAVALHHAGMTSVAVLVVLTAIVFPALEIGAMLWMLLPLHFRRIPPGMRVAFRMVGWVRPWGMIEVFILGALVAFVKLHDLARVHAGVALFAVGAFVWLLAAADASWEPRKVWHCARSLQS